MYRKNKEYSKWESYIHIIDSPSELYYEFKIVKITISMPDFWAFHDKSICRYYDKYT